MRRKLVGELVRRGLADSPQDAASQVDSGMVLVSGAVATNPSRLVDPSEPIVVSADSAGRRFASRGGLKLDHALDFFGIDIQGKLCLDVGASTGGFTSCLLSRGASLVVSVDVGYGLMDDSVRADSRVRCLERTNIRDCSLESLGGNLFDLVSADVSFLSLTRIASKLCELVSPVGDMVLLVKPQFEASRREASVTRGVIRDPEVWRRTVREVAGEYVSHDMGIMGCVRSPVQGAKGNTEFLLGLSGPHLKPRFPGLEVLDESPEFSRQFTVTNAATEI